MLKVRQRRDLNSMVVFRKLLFIGHELFGSTPPGALKAVIELEDTHKRGHSSTKSHRIAVHLIIT